MYNEKLNNFIILIVSISNQTQVSERITHIQIASEANEQADIMMYRSRHIRADKRSDDVSDEGTSILGVHAYC
jgi:hypothetical protein